LFDGWIETEANSDGGKNEAVGAGTNLEVGE
jgi:hypothetical protein